MRKQLDELKTRLMEIYDLQHSGALLSWDEATYMPPAGAAARGRQTALLGKLAQEKSIDPLLGKLLDELRPYGESLPYDSDDASLIRVARRDYERAIKVPPKFVAEFYEHSSKSYNTWVVARPENNFKALEPLLERSVDLSRQMADFFPGYEHIADPLIDFADYGMKSTTLRSLFAQLRRELIPIVQSITAQPPADDSCLKQHYPGTDQLAFGLEVIKQLGFDFNRGRQDLTHHPFMTSFSLGDVRITTRVDENDLTGCLFSTIHEAGHAMYEQGIRMELEGTPLGGGVSAGIHESQSRTWENLVGRSRGFWEYFYPKLQAKFPDQLKGVSLETFYRAVNKVQRSLIRTEADEVTYNLHVMIRFDIELALLEGNLLVRDLPEYWHVRYNADLGLRAPDDRDGVMQDVHWFGGTIGGSFQGYTLGNIFGAQFFTQALNAHPEIPFEMGKGKFDTLHTWLVDHVYQHGNKFTANELIGKATGGPLTIEPYIAYLKTKFGELYKID
ncbi:MAG: carboxypeptidase [Chloroflexi bacterium RBG_19FT_COMBO_49_13]|nr:MAG: carboxypeptidase [Chloroflexi bacterium RBG_19FT_COMBO_49_13]